MKEGWVYKTAGEVFTITDFVSNGSFASLRENVKYLDHPDYAVLIRLADYSNGFDKNNFVYVSKQSYEYLAKSKLFGGEIIMSNVGSIGKSFLCPNLNCPMTIGPNAILIRSNNNKFFLYYFQSEDFNKKLLSISSRATLKKFNKTNFKTLSIPIPPLPEQQQIVSFLDSEFEKIDALKANAETQLQAAKDLFQKALKEMLTPKDGWEEKKLGEVGTFTRGGNFTKSNFVEHGIPCIHYGQIHMRFGVSTKKTLSYLPDDFPKVKYAKTGDLIIAITSEDDEGSCKCTAWLGEKDVAVGGHIAVFHHQLDPIFMSYYFMSPRFQSEKIEYTHGFKVVEIKPSDIAKIGISYPTVEEQKQIVIHLDTLSAKVKQLQENYNETITLCNDLKQSLLKKIFE